MGQNQYHEFVTERLEARSKSLFEPIKQNNLPLFSSHPLKSKSEEESHAASLKQNVSLFSQLSCQVRDGNLDTFFSRETKIPLHHSLPMVTYVIKYITMVRESVSFTK